MKSVAGWHAECSSRSQRGSCCTDRPSRSSSRLYRTGICRSWFPAGTVDRRRSRWNRRRRTSRPCSRGRRSNTHLNNRLPVSVTWPRHTDCFFNPGKFLFGSKIGFSWILDWIHFTTRFGGVHAFGYNSAESEPIWMSGTLWVHYRGLPWHIFGAIRTIATAGEPGDIFVR